MQWTEAQIQEEVCHAFTDDEIVWGRLYGRCQHVTRFFKLLAANVVGCQFHVQAGVGGLQSQSATQRRKSAKRFLTKLRGPQPVLRRGLQACCLQHMVAGRGNTGEMFQLT